MTRDELLAAYGRGQRDFRNANLSSAVLRNADLRGADLSGAYLSGAYLAGAYLWNADLSGAYLSQAVLAGAYLSQADLSGANLWRADLSGANLADADLRGADLRNADLSGAHLSGVIGLVELPTGDCRGYRTFAVLQTDGAWKYCAGCRGMWTAAKALEHWGARSDDLIARRYVRAITWWEAGGDGERAAAEKGGNK